MNEYMELCLPAAITGIYEKKTEKHIEKIKKFMNLHQYYSKDGDGFFAVAEVAQD
jgi:hypothetical protein